MTETEKLIEKLSKFFDPIQVDFTLIEQAADELARLYAYNETKNKYIEWASETIRQLKAELAPFQSAAAEYGINAQTMLKLAKSQISTAKANCKLRDTNAALESDNYNLDMNLEHMTTENAELREAQRWVPVGERLPEEYGENDVLTYDSLGNIEGFEADHIDMWNQNHLELQITHWRPLPDPPQKGELNDGKS